MSDLGLAEDAQPVDTFATIADVPIAPATDRVSPNQVATGVTRGTQTIVGSDSSSITTGVVPNTTRLGVGQYDNTGKLVSELGQQADGSNGLKFFDANGVGIAQFGKFANGSTGLKVAKANVEVGTATNDQLIFNSAQNVLKVIATKSLTVPSLTMLNNTSGSNGTPIDLSAYPTNAIILPIAIQAGQPSFIWQGVQVLSGAIGFSGSVVASYTASFTGGGVYQLSRGIANNASGSSYADGAYTVTIYVLQETVS